MTVDVGHLLHELCTKLGYCLAPADQEHLVAEPPSTPAAFVDAVIRAEGLDPETMDRRNMLAVESLVDKHFGET